MIVQINLQIAVFGRYLLLSFFLLGTIFINAQEKPSFHLEVENAPTRIRFKVVLNEGWGQNADLKLFIGKETSTLPPMAGRILQQGNILEFVPAYGWTEGQSYTALLTSATNTESFKHSFTIATPDRDNVKPVLSTIYPSSDTLPANQLKLYLDFSRPMALGYVYDHVQVFNEQGELLEQPFLLLEPELWDPTGKRLTIWFDPGRLKRDLVPNTALGTPLEAGQSYHLVVKAGWPDRDGAKLEEPYRKTFFVLASDREQPKLEAWDLKVPAPNSRQALQIHFGESLDAALASTQIRIMDENGQVVEGTIRLTNKESVLVFETSTVWQTGNYKIRVAAKLEDLAGNNLNRLFDRDLKDPKQKRGEANFYWLEFKI